jgi:Zn finger protein HypA/HybF involved in hydrogenase expression
MPLCNCGFELKSYKFCPECGSNRMEIRLGRCLECNIKKLPFEKFCRECGFSREKT